MQQVLDSVLGSMSGSGLDLVLGLALVQGCKPGFLLGQPSMYRLHIYCRTLKHQPTLNMC